MPNNKKKVDDKEIDDFVAKMTAESLLRINKI
jgi:hypothetical protein